VRGWAETRPSGILRGAKRVRLLVQGASSKPLRQFAAFAFDTVPLPSEESTEMRKTVMEKRLVTVWRACFTRMSCPRSTHCHSFTCFFFVDLGDNTPSISTI